jgi:hypothetical protein
MFYPACATEQRDQPASSYYRQKPGKLETSETGAYGIPANASAIASNP